MSHDTKTIRCRAFALVMTMALVATAMLCFAETDESQAATSYDEDLGQFYGYRIQFVFNGSDALGVDWDFGDGSAVSSDWNPLHTFPAIPGIIYYVKQIAWNHYGLTDEQITAGQRNESVAVYKITIMGPPVVTFDANGGSAVSSITAAYNKTITEPAAPTKDGATFSGWYTDSKCTQKWNFAADTVTENVTLFAGWTGVVTPAPADDDHATLYVTIFFAVLALISAIALIAVKNPVLAVPLVIFSALAILVWFGYLDQLVDWVQGIVRRLV